MSSSPDNRSDDVTVVTADVVPMPSPRGPLSRYVAQTIAAAGDPAPPPALPAGAVTHDDDAQLALWLMYELHYRGFDGVSEEREWDPSLLALRRQIERRFEAELRDATTDTVVGVPDDGDLGQRLLELAAADNGPSVASFLQRHATREQLQDYLRERSMQQLKEADPYSFVLPRLDGPAKVALAELQFDEYGGGRPERLHARLYAEALEGAGLDRRYGVYLDQVSALTLAGANAVSMFVLNRRLRGAAMGHLAAFEATSSVPCRKIVTGIQRLGFPEVVAGYFDEHVEADAIHEHIAATDICGAMVRAEPALRTDVIFGAATSLYLDGAAGAQLLQRWDRVLEPVS